MVYVKGGEDFETRESLIDEPTFRQYQKAMIEGSEKLVLEDRIIKMSSIAEILPDDGIVKEYLDMGVSLKTLGLKEPLMVESEKNAGQKRFEDMKGKSEFGKAF